MLYKVRFTLGDWSDDGHGGKEAYHMKSNYPGTKINDVLLKFENETNCNIKKLDGITIEIAKIILEIFKEKYNIELSIKEPNDIVYNSKKIMKRNI